MSFKQDNSVRAPWRKWLWLHRAQLSEAGLPLAVFETEESWWKFLEHGYVEQDPSRFVLSQFSIDQRRALHDFLESELSIEEKRSAITLAHLKSLLETYTA